MILTDLGMFYERNGTSITSTPARAFSGLIYNEAQFAYKARKENGGWAGDFTRFCLLSASRDIRKNLSYWENSSSQDERDDLLTPWQEVQFFLAEKGTEYIRKYGRGDLFDTLEATLAVEKYKNLYFEDYIEGTVKGMLHFEKHLTPAFREYITNEFTKIAKRFPKQGDAKIRYQVYLEILRKMKEIRAEHIAYLENALTPAVKLVFPWSYEKLIREEALDLIPELATKLRVNSFEVSLSDIKKQGLVNGAEVEGIISFLQNSENDDWLDKFVGQKPEFLEKATQKPLPQTKDVKPHQTEQHSLTVKTLLSTEIPINKGDKVAINARGRIVLGAFAGAGGPDGIDGFTEYNAVRGARHGALLARVKQTGQETWHTVYAQGSFTAETSGTLELLVNDRDASNNSGQFDVQVEITRAK